MENIVIDETINNAAEEALEFIDNLTRLQIMLQTEADKAEGSEMIGLDASHEGLDIAGPVTFFRMSQVLYREGKPTMSELSNKLMVSYATGTRLVAWWVKNGLAVRQGDPKDRRIVRVRLTEKGHRFHEVMQERAVEAVKKGIGRLTVNEQALFRLLLAKITAPE